MNLFIILLVIEIQPLGDYSLFKLVLKVANNENKYNI